MSKKLFSSISLLCCAALLSVGCATIFKGKNSSIATMSSPDGAEVFVNGVPRGKTPLSLQLDSSHGQVITFKKPGYKDHTVTLTSQLGAGWLILDILFGITLVPIIVDAATGSWNYLSPDSVGAQMEKL